MPVRYTRVGWQDAPSTDTPIDAANLNHMDNGILALSEELDTELPLIQEQTEHAVDSARDAQTAAQNVRTAAQNAQTAAQNAQTAVQNLEVAVSQKQDTPLWIDFGTITGTGESVSVTKNVDSVTDDMLCTAYWLSNPSVQTANWTVTTATGSVTISGPANGSTLLKIKLEKVISVS